MINTQNLQRLSGFISELYTLLSIIESFGKKPGREYTTEHSWVSTLKEGIIELGNVLTIIYEHHDGLRYQLLDKKIEKIIRILDFIINYNSSISQGDYSSHRNFIDSVEFREELIKELAQLKSVFDFELAREQEMGSFYMIYREGIADESNSLINAVEYINDAISNIKTIFPQAEEALPHASVMVVVIQENSSSSRSGSTIATNNTAQQPSTSSSRLDRNHSTIANLRTTTPSFHNDDDLPPSYDEAMRDTAPSTSNSGVRVSPHQQREQYSRKK